MRSSFVEKRQQKKKKLSMNQEFWHDLWKNNKIGFNQQQPHSFLKQYFSQLKLKKTDKIFVPLCGKSIDMIWLVEQGYKVTGIELSLIACETFFNDNHISYNVIQDSEFALFKVKILPYYAEIFSN